jgi:hypothetical protein
VSTVAVALAIALALPGVPAAGEGLTQRVWLLQGVPVDTTLASLRAGGVDGLVLPVGSVAVDGKSCRLTMTPLPDLGPLASWDLTPLVWVAGEGDAAGDAKMFLDEFAPVERLVRGGGPIVLAARAEWPGLLDFAEAVARRRGGLVEVLLPARDAARVARGEVSGKVRLLAVALGNPSAMGFPVTTPADDLAALDEIEDAGVPYRVAVVVTPVATPAPGALGSSLAALALPRVAEYRPTERGDAFVLRQRLDWGGVWLSPGDTVRVETVDAARLHRDLGLVLRGVRPRLQGWDLVGLPSREPALGLSLEAFLDYLQGGLPGPAPRVQVEWVTPTRLLVALANPTPHGSAVATTGNYVEVRFEGTQVLDVALGDFSGTDYGRTDQGTWRRAVAREANAVRLFLTYLAPVSRVSGAAVTFFGRPAAVGTRWVVRLSEGTEAAGELEPAPAISAGSRPR